MFTLERLLKLIRGVGKDRPVNYIMLSEIIRGLWRDPIETGTKVQQTEHGFSVGTTIKPTNAGWIATKADSVANAGTVGIVLTVIDANTFIYMVGGLLPGEYTVGAKYYLSTETAGNMMTEPVSWTVGQVRQYLGTGVETGLMVEIDAGEEVKLLIEKATGAEITAGTDDVKYLTPKSIKDSNVLQSSTSEVKNVIPITAAAHQALIDTGTEDPKTLYVRIG